MVKMVICFKRKPGMDVAAFQSHWRTVHAGIIARLPGIRRYVQSHVLLASYRKSEPPFDAVAESSFDDTQAMKSLAASPEYAAVLADEPGGIGDGGQDDAPDGRGSGPGGLCRYPRHRWSRSPRHRARTP